MIKNIFSFLKGNFLNLILFTAISLLAYLAFELTAMTAKASKLENEKATLALSVSNVESDKDLLTLSLESERDLRVHLQETIKNNSERLEGYLVELGNIENNKHEKVITLEETAQKLTTENCINSTMPDSIISLFNSTKTD